MKTSKIILLACCWLSIWLTSVATAEQLNPASGVAASLSTLTKNPNPISIEIGRAFNIKLDPGFECSQLRPNDQAKLEQIDLLVNGMNSGLHPLDCDPASNELAFSLSKTDVADSPVSNAAWHALQGHPSQTAKTDFKREVSYTVRLASDSANAKTLSHGKLQLHIASKGKALLGITLVLALWAGLLYLGGNSGMLRDAGTGKNLQNRTYSLGRVQMAWWFGIIMGAYVFLWVLTDDIPPMTSQALILMGISGATGLVATSMDSHRQIQSSFTKGNFLEDLLTDADGITLHRFQMLATTIILGFIFIVHVATTLAMPQFDDTLLALMGIAGGTYLGFKFPEKHTDLTESATVSKVAGTIEDHKAGYSAEP